MDSLTPHSNHTKPIQSVFAQALVCVWSVFELPVCLLVRVQSGAAPGLLYEQAETHKSVLFNWGTTGALGSPPTAPNTVITRDYSAESYSVCQISGPLTAKPKSANGSFYCHLLTYSIKYLLRINTLTVAYKKTKQDQTTMSKKHMDDFFLFLPESIATSSLSISLMGSSQL